MDIREKIKEIIYHESDVEKVLDVVRQEIADAIKETDNTREYTPKEDMFGVGYEQMRTDIRTALKEKGLMVFGGMSEISWNTDARCKPLAPDQNGRASQSRTPRKLSMEPSERRRI